MKKILAEIKAQFESVKGQPTLEELIAKDPELQELCRRIRQGSAAEQEAREAQKTQLPSNSNEQRQFNGAESRKD